MGKKREQKKAVEDASEDQAAQKPKVTNKNTAGKQAAAKSSNEDDNNAEKKPKTKKNRENDPFATENLPFKPPTMHAVDYYRRDQRKAAEQKFPEMKRRDVAKYLKKQYSGESPEVKQKYMDMAKPALDEFREKVRQYKLKYKELQQKNPEQTPTPEQVLKLMNFTDAQINNLMNKNNKNKSNNGVASSSTSEEQQQAEEQGNAADGDAGKKRQKRLNPKRRKKAKMQQGTSATSGQAHNEENQ